MLEALANYNEKQAKYALEHKQNLETYTTFVKPELLFNGLMEIAHSITTLQAKLRTAVPAKNAFEPMYYGQDAFLIDLQKRIRTEQERLLFHLSTLENDKPAPMTLKEDPFAFNREQRIPWQQAKTYD